MIYTEAMLPLSGTYSQLKQEMEFLQLFHKWFELIIFLVSYLASFTIF